MNITLDNSILQAIDLSPFKTSNNYFYSDAGYDQYRLLCYLSSQFNDSLIIDIGTANGDSALAFSYNNTNRILSFDIHKWNLNCEIKNCKYILGSYMDYIDDIFTSKIILYDIPHSGTNFVDFCTTLYESEFLGILILDDYTYDPVKLNDWNSALEKFKNGYTIKFIDATKYGHFTGTGIISFNNDIQFYLK